MKINPKRKPDLEIASELIPDLDGVPRSASHKERYEATPVAQQKNAKASNTKKRDNV